MYVPLFCQPAVYSERCFSLSHPAPLSLLGEGKLRNIPRWIVSPLLHSLLYALISGHVSLPFPASFPLGSLGLLGIHSVGKPESCWWTKHDVYKNTSLAVWLSWSLILKSISVHYMQPLRHGADRKGCYQLLNVRLLLLWDKEHGAKGSTRPRSTLHISWPFGWQVSSGSISVSGQQSFNRFNRGDATIAREAG